MSDNIHLRTFQAIVTAYPAVVPYLQGRAGAIYCEYKAVERDPDEPGRDEKMTTEEKLKRAIQRRLKRQLAQIREQLQSNYGKAINTSGVYVDNDGDEDTELIRLMFEAIQEGVTLASSQVGIYLADGSVNEQALQVARTYVTDWLRQLDEVSQAAVRDAVEAFIQQPGANIQTMIDILNPTFGEARAWRIAVTETTRVYAQANDIYAGELQKEYPEMQVVRTWFTNRDDRVCPICAPLHNKQVGANETFDGIQSPPAHVNCRCWTSTTVKA